MDKTIFDSHAHYNDELFDEIGRDSVIERVFADNVKFVVNAGTDEMTSDESIALAEKYEGIYAAVGFYPHNCINIKDDAKAVEYIKSRLSHKKVVAIGEIGLDYHYDDTPRDIQIKWFNKQLDIAIETGYPVVVHDREAHGDTLEIIKQHKKCRGILHSFSGSYEMAKELIKLGWYISISGVVTYKNAVKTVEVGEKIPLDRLLIETDSPYLSPVPMRSKLNDSSNLRYTAQKIAEIRNITAEEVCKATLENACRIYGIK